jgi:ubiquinone/menaquinone biosynthesis C-methylase UbiE
MSETVNLPPGIAFVRLAMAAADEADFRARIATLPPGSALRHLAARHPDAWRIVHDIAATVDHSPASYDPAEHVRRLAGMFDRAAAVSPEASVALYSLGDRRTLERATAEIVAWLARHRLLGRDVELLDLGCGIGRLERTLASRVGYIEGIDISPAMIAEARRRCAVLGNVGFHQSSGLDLAEFGDECFDGVVALDSFPYVVAAGDGLAGHMLAEIARVLRPGGWLAIFNYAYGSHPDGAAAELDRLARRAGLLPVEMGSRPFDLWDGAAFLLRRS